MLRKAIFAGFVLILAALVGFRLYEELAPKQAQAGSPAVGPGGRGGPGGGPGGAAGGRGGAGGPGRGAGPGGPGGFAGARPALLVETASAEPKMFVSRLEAVGELKPAAAVEVMSRVSGRLQQVLVDRGDSVREGQLLAVVDDADLQQQIRRSEASINVARAAYGREKASSDNLANQLERYQRLHGEKLISDQDLQDLESRVRASQSQIALQAAEVDQAEAALHELKIQHEQTRIYAPLSGYIGSRYLDPGALVSPSVAIVSVLKLDRVKTVVAVGERMVHLVRVGQNTRMTADASPDTVFSGAVTRISPFLDPETRSAEVEIEVPNPGRRLKPGMFVRVALDAGVSQQSLSIPRAALLTRGEQKGVYLLSEKMTTLFHPITVGRIEGDAVEVLAGLDQGAVVVSTGAQNLNDGDRVQLPGPRKSD